MKHLTIIIICDEMIIIRHMLLNMITFDFFIIHLILFTNDFILHYLIRECSLTQDVDLASISLESLLRDSDPCK